MITHMYSRAFFMSRLLFVFFVTVMLTGLLFPTPAGAVGNVAVPTTGSITQYFLSTTRPDASGNYYDQNDQLQKTNKKFHSGVDISNGATNCTQKLSPVYAAAGGTVIFADYDTSGF